MQWTRHAKVMDAVRKQVTYEYEKLGHFLMLRSSVFVETALVSGGESDMGGNKGYVPIPHYGVNMNYAEFSELRERLRAEERSREHAVARDAARSLAMHGGHAPAINLLDPYHLLFPDDPDTCLSLLTNDPSGNVNEFKWYLDFGEMFHKKGSVGGVEADNTMLGDHFPPELLARLQAPASA